MTQGDRSAGKPPTLNDVARAAGVSRAMASIVLRGAPGAADETRTRVLAAAAELGYRRDTRASLLRRSDSRLIGLVFQIESRFHADLVAAIREAVDAAGYDLVLGIARRRGHDELQAIDMLLGYRCDALLLLGTSLSEEVLAGIASQRPVVAITRRLSVAVPGCDTIRVSDREGFRLLVDHLVALGHRDIAHVDGGDDAKASDRLNAYVLAMEAHGLGDRIRVYRGGEWADEGRAAARPIMESAPLPTALVAYNDDVAWGVMGELSRSGVRVPADISVTGYDLSRTWLALPQRLTTVRQDVDALGRLSVARAIARLQGGADEQQDIVIEPAFVPGDTTGPPRSDADSGAD